MIKEPELNEIEDLKRMLINKIKNYGINNAMVSLRNGNLIYILLYCEEGLKLFVNYLYYSKCLYTIKKENVFKELKEVLKW